MVRETRSMKVREGSPYFSGTQKVDTEQLDISGDVVTVSADSDWAGATGGEMIQSAIDASSPGDEVWVVGEGPDNPASSSESDVWEVTSHIHNFPDDFTLKGIGKPLLYLGDNSDDDVIRVKDLEGDAPAENLIIEGFRINGNRANNTGVDDPNAGGGSRFTGGVYVFRSEDLIVRDVHAVDVHGYGINIKGSFNAHVEDCSVVNSADDGFSITDIDYSTAITQKVTVRNCRSFNNDDSGFEVDDGPYNVLFDDCHGEGSGDQFAVHSHSGRAPEAPKHVTFKDCVAIGGTRAYLLGNQNSAAPEDYNVIDCYAEGQTVAAVAVDDATSPVDMKNITISGLTAEWSGADAAIELAYGSNLSNVTIKDSTINLSGGAGNGIVAADVAIEQLTIDNVTIHGNGTTSNSYGISMPGRSGFPTINVEVTNCEISGFNRAGILAWGAGDELTGVKFTNNDIYNNGLDTGLTGERRAAISIIDNGSQPTDCMVRGNRCYDDQGTKTQLHGVWHNGADFCLYSDNILRGNATSGFGGTLGANSIEADNIT